MTALIDADIVAYRCAASAENDPEEIAILRTENLMKELLAQEPDYIAFLTGTTNFRYEINPDYKANRKDKPKPVHLEACANYLLNEYNAIVTDGYEADDALGIHQTDETIIFSIDKDLLCIPGHHYNFVKGEYIEVSELDGLRQFYRQMLIGDTTDNIFGIPKIGKVKAAKLIDHLTSEKDMHNVVNDLYWKTFNDDKQFFVNADCLWIMRHEGETYSERIEKVFLTGKDVSY